MTDDRQARCFDLEFGVDGRGRSFLGAQFVRYPVHVCRGLRVDARAPGLCSVALQSVSGGLFEGDDLAGSITAREGARARVTTSASTIVHAMRSGCLARQSVELRALSGALLEYLPEPLILFPGSRVCSETRVRLADGATVAFCEGFLAHDPKQGGRGFGMLDARVEVRSDAGRLLARERMLLDGEAWAAGQAGVSSPFRVHGALWILRRGDGRALLDAAREAIAAERAHAGASELPNAAGIQVRVLAEGAVELRRCLEAVWRGLNPVLGGAEAVPG